MTNSIRVDEAGATWRTRRLILDDRLHFSVASKSIGAWRNTLPAALTTPKVEQGATVLARVFVI